MVWRVSVCVRQARLACTGVWGSGQHRCVGCRPVSSLLFCSTAECSVLILNPSCGLFSVGLIAYNFILWFDGNAFCGECSTIMGSQGCSPSHQGCTYNHT